MKKIWKHFIWFFLLALILTGCRQDAVSPSSGDSATAQSGASETTEWVNKEMSVTELLSAVATLKSDMEAVLDDMKADEWASAQAGVESVTRKTEIIRTSLNATMESLGDSMPSLQAQLQNIQDILDLADTAMESVVSPLIIQLQAHPLSEMKSGDGIRTDLLCEYLDFIEDMMPDIETMVQQANETDLSLIDSDGSLSEKMESANLLVEMYQTDSQVFTRLKSMLGGDGDRLYLLAAQNSAEIRASGGFPGSMGTLRISDGILTIGDFKTVYKVLSSYTPSAAGVTSLETTLFRSGLSAPRDADYCPDFERVACIWALGYQAAQGEHIDGVISMTPAVVQKLLAAAEAEITLSDSTVLNGENAVKILQHDLYFKYFSYGVSNGATISDQLFAEAAKLTSQVVTENLSFSDLTAYLSVATECFSDRTMMMWMEDENEQALLQALNWNGGLNTDPENPQAGIYYSCTVPSKMGWFLIVDTEIGEGTENADGSYTYPITVTFSNDMTQEEISSAASYITGGYRGTFYGCAYFFAPVGGSISEITVSNGSVGYYTYHDLDLGYLSSLVVSPSTPVVVTYTVTTAPGVDTPLTISQTPTVQDYHE